MTDYNKTYENIPEILRTSDLWCNFILKPQPNKKARKVPVRPGRGGISIDPTDTSHGRSFDQALKYASRYDGIGRIFSESESFIGIDLDNVNESHPLLIQARNRGAYVERSVSGTGWHIICQGELPSQAVGNGIEVYGSLRYFVFTGKDASGSPIEAQSLIDSAVASTTKQSQSSLADDILSALSTEHERVLEAIATYPDISEEFDFKLFTRAVAANYVLAGLSQQVEIKQAWEDRCKQSDNYNQDDNLKALQRFIADSKADRNKTPADYLLKHLSSQPLLPTSEPQTIFKSAYEMYNAQTRYDWLIRSVAERSTRTLIFGDYGTYKSFIALDIALHVAAGLPWFGNEVTQGPAVLLIGEGGSGINRRIQAWFKKHDITPDESFPLYISTIPANLSDKKQLAKLVVEMDKISTIKPEFIAIDTLHNSMGGGDENSAKDIAIVLDHLGMIQRTFDSSVWVVHHTGQANKERSRGSYSIEAGFDNIYRIDKVAQQSVTMTQTKLKDGQPIKPIDMFMDEIHLGEDDGYPVTSMVVTDMPESPGITLGRGFGFSGKKLEAFVVLFEMGGISESVAADELRQAVMDKFVEDGYDEYSARKNAERAVRGICENEGVFKRKNTVKIRSKS